MKLFHLENMVTQRNPRASAGRVHVTTVSIENKIIGGRAQEQSSPLCDHPMYRMLEAYVIAHMAAQDEAPAGTHIPNPDPPSAGADIISGTVYSPSKNNFVPHMPDLPRPAGRPLGQRPVDRTAPRGKK